jgi:hypothetical protein
MPIIESDLKIKLESVTEKYKNICELLNHVSNVTLQKSEYKIL